MYILSDLLLHRSFVLGESGGASCHFCFANVQRSDNGGGVVEGGGVIAVVCDS